RPFVYLTLQCKNALRTKQVGWDDARHVGEREHFFRQRDAQNFLNEAAPTLAALVTLWEAPSEFLSQGSIDDGNSILHASREEHRRGRNDIGLNHHSRPDANVRSFINWRTHPFIQVDEVAGVEEDAELVKRQTRPDHPVEHSARLTDAQMIEPFGHRFKIGTGKGADVISRHCWQILHSLRNPAGSAD